VKPMMTSRFPVDELIRRAVDLNVRYYSGMSQLMATYVKDLVVTFSDLATTQTQASPPHPQTAPSTQKSQQSPVMVLEAESGKEALGVFLVENHLGHSISTRVVPSSFFDAVRNEIKPSFVFDPEAVSLRSGEQVLVRVKAQIDDTFAPDVSYQGSVNIPELTGSTVRIVLRRRSVAPEGTSPETSRESVAGPAAEKQRQATKTARKQPRKRA
jgi:hypothetical protein